MSKKDINCCDRCGETYTRQNYILDNNCYEVVTLETSFQNEFEDESEFDVNELIILEVAKRRPLYDSRLPVQQRSKIIIQELWNEIHFILKDYISLEDIKKRWRVIRDRFIRTKRTKYILSDSAAPSNTTGSTYKYAALLKFLDDTTSQKKTESNLAITAEHDDNSGDSLPYTPTRSKSKRRLNDSDGLEAELLKKLKEPCPLKKVDKLDDVDYFCKSDPDGLEAELLKNLKEPCPLKEVDKLDDVDYYCKSLASGLRQLDYRKRLKLQIKYMELLDESLN